MPYDPLLPIDSIDVGERYRKDLGDLDELASSIAVIGLLHPITVIPGRRSGRWLLVAGERRLRACQRLGLDRVAAKVLADPASLLRAEHDENVVREPFAPSEAVAIAAALRPVVEAGAKARQGASRFGASETDGPPPSPNFGKGRTDDRLAAAVGMGRTALRQATEVVEAAADDPNLQPLVEAMDETGKVDPAHRALKSLPPDPTPADVEAALVESDTTRQARESAEAALSEDPRVLEAARAARLAKVIHRHGEAQYALAAETWADGLTASDIAAMHGHLVATRLWVEAWERAIADARPLRVVGGSDA